jgi:hypothetical protein
MNGSIFDETNEEYLRKIVESDDRMESEAKVALDKILESKNDIREIAGNKGVSPSILPSRGLFYPSDLVITISPLKVKQIRHFSSIDETDEIDISTKLNFIINSSVSVQTSSQNFRPSSLLEMDRLYLLFLIRNITFTEFPTIIKLESTCDSCNHTDMVDLKAERLGSLKEGAIDDYLALYSSETRSIRFQMKGETLDFYFPSIHNLDESRRQIIEQNLSFEQQDKFMLCFMVPPNTVLRGEDFDNFDKQMEEWSPDKYAAIRSFVNTVNSSYSIDVYYKCSECGAGVATPLRFHGGIKELFVPGVSNRFK